MTIPYITGFVAGILAIVFVVLQLNVIRWRLRTGTSLYHGDDKALGTAIRRHANLAENLALALVLLALLEILGGPDWLIYILGFALIAARIAHPFGLDYDEANRKGRVFGAVVTTSVIGIAAIWLIGIYLGG